MTRQTMYNVSDTMYATLYLTSVNRINIRIAPIINSSLNTKASNTEYDTRILSKKYDMNETIGAVSNNDIAAFLHLCR